MDETGVAVHLFAAARAAVGRSELVVAPGTLASVLGEVEKDHPPFAAVRSRCSYLVDGVAQHDEDVVVAPGSRVDVLPPFAGG